MKIWRLAGIPGAGLAVAVLAGATFACDVGPTRLADAQGVPGAIPARIEPVSPAFRPAGPAAPAAAQPTRGPDSSGVREAVADAA